MKKRTAISAGLRALGAAALLLAGLPVFSAGVAFACDNCGCVAPAHVLIRNTVTTEHTETGEHIFEEFQDLEEFLVDVTNPLNTDTIFGRYILPSLMWMTEQIVHTAMYQTMIIGPLIDAKLQLETQTLFQKLAAEAHKDYQPSHDMCVIGTNIRSLAATERHAEFTAFLLSQRSMDRQMGNLNSAATRGVFDDHCFRMRQFRKRYCDMRDNNEHMNWVCDPEAAATAAGVSFGAFREECIPDSTEITNETKNKDISFIRTIDRAKTLDVDFITPAPDPSDDEEDIFALASNLYSHDVVYRMPETALRQRQSQDELLDMRHIVAKRAVAEHSFNTIVGMKATGTTNSTTMTYPYMSLILKSLDIGDDGADPAKELALFLGEKPSYDAQMEVLTKRIFQSPDFYANLYDEPANVERKGVALQAIGLMQDFDTWNSYLRTEAMLSVVLELELLRMFGQVQNAMGTMRSGGLDL